MTTQKISLLLLVLFLLATTADAHDTALPSPAEGTMIQAEGEGHIQLKMTS